MLAALNVHAQTMDCGDCEDRLKEAFAKDPLIVSSQNGQLQMQQDMLKATRISIELTLQICGACLPEQERTALEQQQSSLDETIKDLQQATNEISFRPDENNEATGQEPSDNQQQEIQPEPESGKAYRAR